MKNKNMKKGKPNAMEIDIIRKKAEILDIIREQEMLQAKINELQEIKQKMVAELMQMEK